MKSQNNPYCPYLIHITSSQSFSLSSSPLSKCLLVHHHHHHPYHDRFCSSVSLFCLLSSLATILLVYKYRRIKVIFKLFVFNFLNFSKLSQVFKFSSPTFLCLTLLGCAVMYRYNIITILGIISTITHRCIALIHVTICMKCQYADSFTMFPCDLLSQIYKLCLCKDFTK